MVVRRSVEIAATSRADDLALRALAEIVAITSEENVRIVGGQMVALLMAAFPVSGLSPRRTRDADTAITTELAGSGVLHDRLASRGWTATLGNHYVRPVHELTVPGQPAPKLSVDLLVPSLDGRFRPALHGGRAFDSAPGLGPALASEPIEIAARIKLLSNTTAEFVARVPTVEMAVVIKASAYASRRVDRDIEDIYRLFEVVDAYPAEVIGGWRLNELDLRGSRRDATVHLRELGRQTRQLRTADVPRARLAALIAGHLHIPDS